MTYPKPRLLPALACTLVMFSSPAAVAQGFTAATKSDSAEFRAYRLTIEDVRKYYAVMLAGIRLARTHPELAKADTADLSEAPLTVQARQFEASPEGRELLRAGGLTGRQYIVIGYVFAGAELARLGGDQSFLIHPANVAFINEHQAELERLQGEVQAALPESLRAPVMSMPAEGVRETVHLVVVGGPNAGTYDAQTSEGGCSYGLAGQGSWGNALSLTNPDPKKLSSLDLIVPNASAAAAGARQFLIIVGFGSFNPSVGYYQVDTRTEDRHTPSGSGTVTVEDRGNTATVTFSAQTSAGVKLEGKIECRSVIRVH
jgi:hypothetical protein